MGRNFIIAMAMHGAVFAILAFGGFFFSPRHIPPGKPVPVNIMTISEFTQIKAGSRKGLKTGSLSKPKPKPKPKKKTRRKRPKSRPARASTVKKKTSKQKKKTVPKKAKPKTKKAAKPKPGKRKVVKHTPKQKNGRKSKRNFSADKIAALLNKLPSKSENTGKSNPGPKTKKVAKGHEQGNDITMSVNEIDAFVSQISGCWVTPIGGLGAERIVVKMKLILNRDGSLSGAPKVMNTSSSPFFRTAKESAVRAVLDCQPYKLPVSKYKLWREMVLNFDPRRMYGG